KVVRSDEKLSQIYFARAATTQWESTAKHPIKPRGDRLRSIKCPGYRWFIKLLYGLYLKLILLYFNASQFCQIINDTNFPVSKYHRNLLTLIF
ncbi:MAG: hypothetical protein KIT82_19460, partial [Bradyrhizobium sp.]|nr:hypothetical protein [Bradyrhizobium sp.]